MLQNRHGFGGGFKLTSDYIDKRLKNRKSPRDASGDNKDKEVDESKITKEEIIAHLNLTGQEFSGTNK